MDELKRSENPMSADPPPGFRPVHLLKASGFAIGLILGIWLAIVLFLHFVFPRTDWLMSIVLATLAAVMLAAELLFEAFFLAFRHGLKKLFRSCFKK